MNTVSGVLLYTMPPTSENVFVAFVKATFPRDLSLEGVVYEENGQRVATAAAAEVLGNPLNSLAWLANALGKLGGKLSAGDVVMTGSISKVFRPKAGDAVRASFTRLGSVSCRFV